MKRHLLCKLSAVSLFVAACCFVLWACQKEVFSDNGIDAQIAASPEMENYIIAGYEMQAALNEFQQALNKIDWSTLSWVKDADGHEVFQLPIQSLNFETKLRQFNDIKDKLQHKFPQLLTFSADRSETVIETCVERSVAVNVTLLDQGINIFIPRTKQRGPELRDPLTKDGLMELLAAWTSSPTVEAMFIGYRNGRYDMYVDSRNDLQNAYPPNIVENGGNYYWRGGGNPNSPINLIGHTHFGNDSIPSYRDTLTRCG